MNVKERLKRFVKTIGLSVSAFEKSIGASNGYVNSIAKSIGIDKLEKIIEIYSNMNIEWLLTGNGSMLKEDPIVSEKMERKLIPLWDGVTIGGTGEVANLNPQTVAAEQVDAGDWFRDATSAMRVHGDSMCPMYKSGSIVALKEVHDKRLIIYGQDYVVETSEYRVIKRLQRSEHIDCWLCCSVNEELYASSNRLIHEPFDVPIDSVIRLHRVLGNVFRTECSRIVPNHSPN
ncbi:MAG: hypothetical protein JEZ14_22745 [Marinilabiliaceae bacterium]|nr:hypothetical protein [Marinilabiliaceae bacterium]